MRNKISDSNNQPFGMPNLRIQAKICLLFHKNLKKKIAIKVNCVLFRVIVFWQKEVVKFIKILIDLAMFKFY